MKQKRFRFLRLLKKIFNRWAEIPAFRGGDECATIIRRRFGGGSFRKDTPGFSPESFIQTENAVMVEEFNKKSSLMSIFKLLCGGIVTAMGIFLTISYFDILKFIFLGCVGPFLILVGFVMVAVAKE